ncbi:MAG: hypothetical protein WC071_07955 [Victivallaceae bacterium]
MKFNQIVRWITWLFNLLFYICLLNLVLFIFYALSDSLLSLWERVTVIAVINLSVWYSLGKHLYRNIISLKNPENQPTIYISRFHTAQKFLLLSLFVDIVLFCIVWAFASEFLYFEYVWLILMAFPVGAVVWGLFRPQARDIKNFQIWLTFGIIVEIMFFLFLFFCFSITPHQINYSSKNYTPANYVFLPEGLIKRMLPERAFDIKISGRTGLGLSLGASINWTCRVAEADFITFAKSNGYELKENDYYYNANPETNRQRIDSSSLLSIKKLPESFYYYNYRYRNNGGWTFLYDRTTQTLYGHFASN